jgi:hypothetical protein
VHDNFLCGLIPKIEAQIIAILDAIDSYSGDGIISYTFNTGQTNQSVTKSSLKDMQSHLDSLLSRRDTLIDRCGSFAGGSDSSFNAQPGY